MGLSISNSPRKPSSRPRDRRAYGRLRWRRPPMPRNRSSCSGNRFSSSMSPSQRGVTRRCHESGTAAARRLRPRKPLDESCHPRSLSAIFAPASLRLPFRVLPEGPAMPPRLPDVPSKGITSAANRLQGLERFLVPVADIAVHDELVHAEFFVELSADRPSRMRCRSADSRLQFFLVCLSGRRLDCAVLDDARTR